MKIKENLFQYFEKAGIKDTYRPHDIIYMQEDDSTNIYLIVKGRVRVYNISLTGEEITFEILDKGRIFGESSVFQNSSRPTTVTAISDVELISCRLDDLYPYLSESKELTVSLLQHMSQTCDHVTSLLKKAYTYNRYEKIASFLLEQPHTQIPYSISYTHEEMSTIVGLSRVTITKVLNEFVKKGYIQNKYRRIVIIDVNGLEDILNK
ncbi:MAG: Crp/Fnr family transcriptional regulator [Erysipelotrichales bacterium]|nr:Crp/Fnr family transcriptional regulator [Erysipelotrichales bacterium]